MDILVKTAQFLLSIAILVFLHELGHFILARIFHTRVERFFIFFHPWFALYRKKIGHTEFGVGWIPLGGYVKISGMIDESMDRDQMKKPAQPWEFRSKPPWQRLFIMLGGVLMNFFVAFAIYSATLSIWGDQYLPAENMKYGIMCDSLALKIGLQHGDHIVALDDRKVGNYQMIMHDLILNDVDTIHLRRNGQRMGIHVPDTLISRLLKSNTFIAPRIPFYVRGFPKESPAEKAGLKEGDRITGINGKDIRFFDQFKQELGKYKNETVEVQVERNGKQLSIPVQVQESGLIGVYPDGDLSRFFELEKKEYSALTAIPAGISKGYGIIVSYLKQLKLIFTPKTKAYESLGGFIKFGSIFPGTWNWQTFWNLTALISIILAVLNILPIPALDGGHVLFLMYEIISGRKPDERFMEYAQITGMLILLFIIIYANGNDIIQLFKN